MHEIIRQSPEQNEGQNGCAVNDIVHPQRLVALEEALREKVGLEVEWDGELRCAVTQMSLGRALPRQAARGSPADVLQSSRQSHSTL